jgi:hypothetical protein
LFFKKISFGTLFFKTSIFVNIVLLLMFSINYAERLDRKTRNLHYSQLHSMPFQ